MNDENDEEFMESLGMKGASFIDASDFFGGK